MKPKVIVVSQKARDSLEWNARWARFFKSLAAHKITPRLVKSLSKAAEIAALNKEQLVWILVEVNSLMSIKTQQRFVNVHNNQEKIQARLITGKKWGPFEKFLKELE